MAIKKETPVSTQRQETFYKEVLLELIKDNIPFLVGGTYAFNVYTGARRPTHDLDLFCKTSDYPLITKIFTDKGYKTKVDDRWLMKVYKGKEFIDFIFSTLATVCVVDDTWFKRATTHEVFGLQLQYIAPEEIIWTKSFRQDREKFDAADIYHIILKKGKTLDWKHLMTRMEAYWEILLSYLIMFRFVYPSHRDSIPRWVMEELLKRAATQLSLPNAEGKVCRGRLFSVHQYEIDFTEWGYTDRDYII